jgi:hypothetical protein
LMRNFKREKRQSERIQNAMEQWIFGFNFNDSLGCVRLFCFSLLLNLNNNNKKTIINIFRIRIFPFASTLYVQLVWKFKITCCAWYLVFTIYNYQMLL